MERRAGVTLTGQLGDVMKESAQIALSYLRAHGARARAAGRRRSPTRGVHVHVPAGAVPKDGPSAGVTMTTALASLLSGRPVRSEVGDDRRGVADRPGAADRWREAEAARRAPGRADRGDHPEAQRAGPGGRAGGGAGGADRAPGPTWPRCSSSRCSPRTTPSPLPSPPRRPTDPRPGPPPVGRASAPSGVGGRPALVRTAESVLPGTTPRRPP